MDEYQVDKPRVRRAFDRAAATYAQYAKLQTLVREEMLARLLGLKIEPQVVVDLGCGPGAAVKVLRQRYPRARVLGVDFSMGMLQEARRWRPWRDPDRRRVPSRRSA